MRAESKGGAGAGAQVGAGGNGRPCFIPSGSAHLVVLDLLADGLQGAGSSLERGPLHRDRGGKLLACGRWGAAAAGVDAESAEGRGAGRPGRRAQQQMRGWQCKREKSSSVVGRHGGGSGGRRRCRAQPAAAAAACPAGGHGGARSRLARTSNMTNAPGRRARGCRGVPRRRRAGR